MKNNCFLFFASLVAGYPSFAQTKVTTTGNNVINTSDPYAADIVIGSDAGTRHDGSIMWWSNASASRISNSNDVFYLSAWSALNANVGLSATMGGNSFFQGNVGIGTTGPRSQVEIRKDVASNQGPVLELTNGAGYPGASSEIFFSTYDRNNGNPSARIKVADNGSFGGNIYFDTKGTYGSSPLYTRMFIRADNGFVGINTTDPKEELSVNGNIRSKQVKVETANWPDYVFKQPYQLKPLADVKSFIDRNHHLSEIPTEAEVAKDGVNLGEMNKVLLKKVEELTLYLIKQEKRIKRLETK